MRPLCPIVALLLMGCGSSAAGGGGTGGEAPTLDCASDERQAPDGSCVRVGVTDCGAGFEPDAQGGCHALLPDEVCPPGMMALPGETACRPVAPCPEGDWAFVEDGPGVVYVDGSYEGGTPDGSKAHPFVRIVDAVAAQVPGATTIAVADGVYDEVLVLQYRSYTIVGRCPATTTIRGAANWPATVLVITVGAMGTTLRGLAITGPSAGLGAAAVTDVWLDQVWIHDTGSHGIDVIAQETATSVTVTNSLIERATEVGIWPVGGVAVADGVVVRDTQPTPAGELGLGVFGRSGGDIALPVPAELWLNHSVVEGSHAAAASVSGSTFSAQRTVLRNTAPQLVDDEDGFGVFAVEDEVLGFRSRITLDQTVVQGQHTGAVTMVGGELTVTRSTVRDTDPHRVTGEDGSGVNVQFGPTGPSTATVTDSTIESNFGAALLVAGSSATVTSTIARQTLPYDDEAVFGDGVLVATFELEGVALPAALDVRTSLIADNARAGIASFGGTVTVGDTLLSCNPIALNGQDLLGPFSFVDEGGTLCACGDEPGACTVQQTQLVPPNPP